jgi:type I restriction enzyme M protein
MGKTFQNLFCRVSELGNEADVEALFVERLLKTLNYPDSAILRKRSLSTIAIGKGSKKENYKPDFVLLDGAAQPIVVVDAKSPQEDCTKYLYQVSGYALYLNQQYPDSNPVRYVVLTNGLQFYVYPWDSATPLMYLRFADFDRQGEKLLELRSNLSFGVFDQVKATKDVYDYRRPALGTLIATFTRCHNMIWKKEKLPPADAFYEFAKIMFVKIREDQRIHDIIDSGKKPAKEDFFFSTHWIESQNKIEDNPLDCILFRRLQQDLEDQIRKGEKKRIFVKEEGIELQASTIFEVVRELEHFDLYGIDEDLNGRMFETFLSATVRGKALGQFFTPRSVVHYMTDTVSLPLTRDYLPVVLDACCGSGGFLIDAMARLFRDCDNIKNFTDKERAARKKKIRDQCLLGIEANERITRIARLNMYLHGDGGSKIFKADGLDHDIAIEAGVPREEENGLKELRSILVGESGLRFDAILTNPPFSMQYKAKDPHERRILEQYTIARTGTGKIASGSASNVLFLERYYGLLKSETGELFTVIDDTVLNGFDSQRYRDFILQNFIIIQVISLPFNAFFRADANIKTSLIHLRRKSADEQQGTLFMAITNNIGHDDHKKDTPHRDNFSMISQFYRKWRAEGVALREVIHNEDPDEPLGCPMQVFTVDKIDHRRFDAFYYAPELLDIRKRARTLSAQGKIKLCGGADFDLLQELKVPEVEHFGEHRIKYFEIGDVTQDGFIVSHREDTIKKLPTRARLQVRAGDVVFAKNNSSRGTTVIIPQWFDGGLVTTGFIGIRPRSENERQLLWLALSDEFFRKQVYYLAITASQPEVREDIFRQEMLLAFPPDGHQNRRLLANAKAVDEARDRLHKVLEQARLIQAGLMST